MSQEPECKVFSGGTKEWLLNGLLHRTDGPALEGASGTKAWWLHGKRHRVDGPAIEWADGAKSWWLNGKLHRTDGPALERANGDKEWWVDGECLGYGADGFWALWEKLAEKERSNWELLQHAPWVK
jgi:hypothetical protein